MTERAEVKRVKVRSDSQLVTQQLSRQCQVKEERMKAYVDKVQELENQFQGMIIEHIARTKNQRADFLAKIHSSLIDSRERRIIVMGVGNESMCSPCPMAPRIGGSR